MMPPTLTRTPLASYALASVLLLPLVCALGPTPTFALRSGVEETVERELQKQFGIRGAYGSAGVEEMPEVLQQGHDRYATIFTPGSEPLDIVMGSLRTFLETLEPSHAVGIRVTPTMAREAMEWMTLGLQPLLDQATVADAVRRAQWPPILDPPPTSSRHRSIVDIHVLNAPPAI